MDDSGEHDIAGFSSVEVMRAESIMRKIDPARIDSLNYLGMKGRRQNYNKYFDGSKIVKSHFSKCTFSEVSFLGTAGAASSFSECVLQDCQIKNACFDFSDFSKSELISNDFTFNIAASGFANTNFSNTKLKGIILEGCNFENSYFRNAYLSNIKPFHCNFENVDFENAILEDVDLTMATIDFSILKKTVFKNVIVSPTGILHSFGGMKDVEDQNKSVIFKFPSSSKEISFSELILLLEDIQAYFYKINDFFALSTINIYFGNHDLAYQYIGMGLAYSLQYKDFRMIEYYCKLASLNHFFTRHQLQLLYNRLKSNQSIGIMTSHEYNVYRYELDRFKRLLIDTPFGLPQMIISVQTNIDHSESSVASEILNYLNDIVVKRMPQAPNYIQVRHNSPFLFDIFLSDSLASLYNFALLLAASFIGLTSSITKIQKIITEHYKIKSLKLDNKLKELDIERTKLQNSSQMENNHVAQDAYANLPPRIALGRIVSLSLSVTTDSDLPKVLRELTFNNRDN